MTYKPKHLERWYERVNYLGENFDAYYIACWRFFRCTPLERANFKFIKAHLADCGDDPSLVIYPMFTDSVMLSRYYVMVHHTATRALRMADMFAARIKTKGCLDPEQEAIYDRGSIDKCWARFNMRSRISLCHESEMSIFAARSPKFPHGRRNSQNLFTLLSEAE